MVDKILALLVPQAIKDRLAILEAEVTALSAWKAQVEAVWPDIEDVSDGTD